jgi:tetratricopeptide (TPR) repeat protein
MSKTLEIDLSAERLIAIAEGAVEDHNYIRALKMLNKNAELHSNDGESYTLYAEIFDDLGLNEKCINNWFKYIDCNEYGDLTEAYEGLAVCYLNLGNDQFSAFYYNKLLVETGELDETSRDEIIKTFLGSEKSNLKFVYPPEIADSREELSQGIEFMKTGEYDKAVEVFESVEEGNECYLSARNYIAMCNIIRDRLPEAEEECHAILEKYPDNVQALTTLAAVKTEQQKPDESKILASKLLTLDINNTEEMYKIATVCCENKMHQDAYHLFCKIEEDTGMDMNVLYFKAVSAFNSGLYDECLDAFDKLVTIYPNAVTAKYYYNVARDRIESGDKTELSYFYRMPKEMREDSLKMLAVISKLSKAECKKMVDAIDLSECIRWCFDEIDTHGENELLYLATECAIKLGFDDIVSDILLNAFLPDTLKMYTLTLIGERNEANCFGVVICNMYKRVEYYCLHIGRTKRKNFVSAYAKLTAHFSIIDTDYGLKFAVSAEVLYSKLEKENRLADASDVDALSAAIYYMADLGGDSVKRKDLSSFFDASEEQIKKILGEI